MAGNAGFGNLCIIVSAAALCVAGDAFLAQVFRVFMSSSASTAATSVSSPGLARFDFSPEFSLLLMACSLRHDQEPAPHLDFGTSLDWQRVLRLAEHHNVTPLLYQARRADTGRIPPAILAELQARFEGIARKNLRFTAELIPILNCLESHGIPAIPFKGPMLAESVYGNLALREFSDLDILVRQSDFPGAREAVRDRGYVPGWKLTRPQENAYLRSGYECSFDGPAGPNLLELQWRILPAFYAVDFDFEEFFARATHVSIGDTSVLALSAEDLLLSLVIHAAKHAWIRLCWLRDIAGASQSPSLDWDRVLQHAKKLGIERILYVSLRLCNVLLNAEIPHSEEFLDDSEVSALTGQIARTMPDSEEYSTESLRYFRLMLRLRERWSDRTKFALRLLFTPSVGEWSLVSLPAPLSPLYRVIRLFRVGGRLLSSHERKSPVRDWSAE